MSIKIIPMKCPNCGANIKIEEDKRISFCPYCGSRLLIDDDNKKYYDIKLDQHIQNDAEIEEIRAKDNANKRTHTIELVLIIVCSIGLLFPFIIILMTMM